VHQLVNKTLICTICYILRITLYIIYKKSFYPLVCQYTCKNLGTAERIFMKFGTGELCEILSSHYNFHIYLKDLTTALHDDPHASLLPWGFASLFYAFSNTLSIHEKVRNITLCFVSLTFRVQRM
jgi:hypothetical protein